jgi:hypothetical protein
MSGRVTWNPTVDSGYAWTGIMRFGLRKARTAQSAEAQRDYCGTGREFLQSHCAHRELLVPPPALSGAVAQRV